MVLAVRVRWLTHGLDEPQHRGVQEVVPLVCNKMVQARCQYLDLPARLAHRCVPRVHQAHKQVDHTQPLLAKRAQGPC